MKIDINKLEELYKTYNKQQYVHPDPLEFLYMYNNVQDREIVALIASALAYGKVAQILKSVSKVLNIMNPSPYAYLKLSSSLSIQNDFKEFVYRFTKGDKLASMLIGVKEIIKKYGSLYNCFMYGHIDKNENILPAISCFVKEFSDHSNISYLIPSPEKGSACKKINLFLRWMVRKDSVDPGGWDKISASKLIIPLDTHMHKIALKLGFTHRKQANMAAALEITKSFKQIQPDDPVKYDFVLTRLGIRDDMDMELMLNQLVCS